MTQLYLLLPLMIVPLTACDDGGELCGPVSTIESEYDITTGLDSDMVVCASEYSEGCYCVYVAGEDCDGVFYGENAAQCAIEFTPSSGSDTGEDEDTGGIVDHGSTGDPDPEDTGTSATDDTGSEADDTGSADSGDDTGSPEDTGSADTGGADSGDDTGGADTGEVDADGDGVSAGDDCDDDDASIGEATTWYADADGDGYGDPDSAVTSCEEPSYVDNGDDCDDDDASVSEDCEEYLTGDDFHSAYCGSSEVAVCLEEADEDIDYVIVYAANATDDDWTQWYDGVGIMTWEPGGDQCGCFAADASDQLKVNGYVSGTGSEYLVYGSDDGDSQAEAVIYGGDQTCDEDDNGLGGGDFVCDD